MNTSRASPLKIILAVDGSEHSLAAVQLVRDLPLPPGSQVTAVGVLTPRQTPHRSWLLAALDQAQTILQGSQAKAYTGLLHGHPAKALTDYADEHKPDLMVVGAKGLRATLGILLGGVAQQFVEYAWWPVLVVRASYAGLRRVLLVIDGSPHSERAVGYLAQFPLPADAEVHVMHVLLPLPPPKAAAQSVPFRAEIPPLSSYEAEQRAAWQVEIEDREGQALLANTVGALKDSGVQATCVLTCGDAATEILDHVRAHKIDLIVAGSRGLGAVKGWLLGSVSRKLIHYAGCSALIVRGGSDDGS